jgi:hypothetical protein
MNTNVVKNNTLLEKILNWDLSKIVDFVVIENPTIPESAVRSSEKEYKYFVYLLLLTGESLSIPTKLVDLIWHAHILHTREYVSFCNEVAGGYIHHKPYIYTDEKFEDNLIKVSELSNLVFGNVVFDFSKSQYIPVVNFYSACN